MASTRTPVQNVDQVYYNQYPIFVVLPISQLANGNRYFRYSIYEEGDYSTVNKHCQPTSVGGRVQCGLAVHLCVNPVCSCPDDF